MNDHYFNFRVEGIAYYYLRKHNVYYLDTNKMFNLGEGIEQWTEKYAN